MKIDSIRLIDFPPLKSVEISGLAGVVVIAGANGSGKSRLKEAITSTFRSPKQPKATVEIIATRETESKAWGAERLVIKQGERNDKLTSYMSTRTSGGTYVGTVVQIDSNRSVTPVKFEPLTLATRDPYEDDTQYTYYLDSFSGRWQQLVNKIYQKVAAQDLKIASYVKDHPEGTNADSLRANPDPFAPYQEIFGRLLPGKQLCAIDPKEQREFHYQIEDSKPLPFSSLSSGEQEVIKVAFDLIWKQIRHCTIFIDEPELHLHPTLTFRLIETIKSIGDGDNQLILFTHSADLISTYYSAGNVYFLDAKEERNQAQRLSQINANHAATARAVSSNLGMFAVGKKLVLVEGKEASIDRLTYHKVAQKNFPEAYVMPMGSVENLGALREVSGELSNAIFGVDLFMIRDRDGLSNDQVELLEVNPRFRCLKRRHVENYFLDEEVLAMVASHFYLPCGAGGIKELAAELRTCAEECIGTALVLSIKNYVSVNGALAGVAIRDADKKSLDDVESEASRAIAESFGSLSNIISGSAMAQYIRRERVILESALKTDDWKRVFPGKTVLARFCGKVLKQDLEQVRQAYVDISLAQKPAAMADITDMMLHFRSCS